MMAVSIAPKVTVKKGDTIMFQVGGPGGGLEATADVYYVS